MMLQEEQISILQKEFYSCRKLLIAIGDETRQSILLTLATVNCKGMRVGDITAHTHLSRPAVSHHLKILREAGVIDRYSEGTKNYYYMKLGGSWATLVGLINRIDYLKQLADSNLPLVTDRALD